MEALKKAQAIPCTLLINCIQMFNNGASMTLLMIYNQLLLEMLDIGEEKRKKEKKELKLIHSWKLLMEVSLFL